MAETKREGNRLYLIGLVDFKREINAGPEKVKKWRSLGAPISHVGGTYRASTERLLEWLEEVDGVKADRNQSPKIV